MKTKPKTKTSPSMVVVTRRLISQLMQNIKAKRKTVVFFVNNTVVERIKLYHQANKYVTHRSNHAILIGFTLQWVKSKSERESD